MRQTAARYRTGGYFANHFKPQRLIKRNGRRVSPDARGLGLGRRILEELEALAKDFGLTTLRLETNRMLKEAQALYRECGYLEVERFNDEPYAHHWFEKVRR